jgi:hypothetical protein
MDTANENTQVVIPVKPGMATTEFWVALAIQTVAMVQAYAGAISPTAAIYVAAFITAIYTAGRIIVKVFGQVDQGTAAGETSAATPPASPNGFTPKLVLGWILALCLLIPLSGCAQTENQRVAQGAILVGVHADTASWLHDNGITNPEQERVLAELLKTEAKAIHAYYDGIEAGDADAVNKAKSDLATANLKTESELSKYPNPPK